MSRDRLLPENISEAVSTALNESLISEQDTTVIFHDLEAMDRRIESAVQTFPAGTLHAVAIKAQPLPPVLRRIAGRTSDAAEGTTGGRTGLEAASLPELLMALESGCPPKRILFDSPAKTMEEIRFALKAGVHLNMDNFQEVERVAELLKAVKSDSVLGLRINPQTGTGAIADTSTSGTYSKFGVPLSESREAVHAAFDRLPQLTCLHVHTGSQGCPPELMVRGVRAVHELAEEINRAPGPGRVTTVDIGGGMPVTYEQHRPAAPLKEYAGQVQAACPGLFEKYKLMTEFGRFVHAGAGFAASRVEYVKEQNHPKRRTAVIHAGADLFLRECYRPEDWRHEILLLDTRGRIKTGPQEPLYVAGPLCFSGDFPVPKDLMLPCPEPGDLLVIRDAGAYTLSMWSRYNSRQVPLVLGYEKKPAGTICFECLKPRETPEEACGFWS